MLQRSVFFFFSKENIGSCCVGGNLSFPFVFVFGVVVFFWFCWSLVVDVMYEWKGSESAIEH